MKKFIKVAFNDKDEVKQLGARWDKDAKAWYVPEDAEQSVFSKWEEFDPSTVPKADSNLKKIHLNVPFEDKDAAKQLGARWDGEAKKWYYTSDKDHDLFSKWTS